MDANIINMVNRAIVLLEEWDIESFNKLRIKLDKLWIII